MKPILILWRTSSRLILLLLAGAVFAYAVAIAVSAVSYYRSTQKVSTEDVKALEDLTVKLDRILEMKGTLASAQAPIDQKNAELKEAVTELRRAKTENAVLSRLDTISANLNFLSEILRNERGKGADAVEQLKAKVAEVKAKIGEQDGTDKIVAVFLRDGGKIVLAAIWPLVLVVIFFYVVTSKRAPERLGKILKPFKSVKLFEAELVLSDEAKRVAEGTFEDYRKQAIDSLDLFVQRKRLVEKFENVVNDAVAIIKKKTGDEPQQYRCTLHVPDLVFADTLCQLLDYLPSGSGRGRIFSIRFGLIGRLWRSRSSDVKKFRLITDAGKSVVDQKELIETWGMSKREAQNAAKGRPSFLGVLLSTDKGDPVGVFYMDSEKETVFDVKYDDNGNAINAEMLSSETTAMLESIKKACQDRGIIEILEKMNEELRGRAPLIRIYEK